MKKSGGCGVALWLAVTCAASAQSSAGPAPLEPVHAFALANSGPMLRQRVLTGEPFTVAGPQGVLVGQQQGEFEAWLLPVKLLSHMSVEATVEGYPVPLELNTMAREIEVRPERTTITYAHIAMTLKQIMFAPVMGGPPVVLFQVDALHPVDLVFRFTPDLRKMWPALSTGATSSEWVKEGASGFYMLHSDYQNFAGAVALPGATAGIMAPYQERPQVHPLEFHLHVDPAQGRTQYFPLLMAAGQTVANASKTALRAALAEEDGRLPAIYAEHVAQVKREAAERTAIETPDAALNADFTWATTSIEQLRTRAATGETALVAGYYASGDSARPGFGWFFGRDALYTLYAAHSFGDFALARHELEFLLARQRADGKMMHEYSQTADQTDWAALPYEYAAADSTPLFLTTLLDYVHASGDVEFLRRHKDNVLRAWTFETTHDANGDGIYDNAQGTGWVESWPPGMPKQESYLALFDEQASRAMSDLATLLDEKQIAGQAAERAEKIHATFEKEYFQPATGTYAFSWNNGTRDASPTIFPAVAWWNGGKGLDHPDASLRLWSSHVLATDWGMRDLAAGDPLYDGMSYHQGSVWPLFTGWAAVAQYRAGHPLAGYQALRMNADLTVAQDPGAVTELLSGDFFEPFGRSTSHQLWSSAMVVVPVVRGMFGIEPDALHHALRVTPHLPAEWPAAEVRRVHVGDSLVDVLFRRNGVNVEVRLRQVAGPAISLTGSAKDGVLRVPVPAVEVSVPFALPARGERTHGLKVLNEVSDAHTLKLELEAPAGSAAELKVVRHAGATKVRAEGAALEGDVLKVTFPTKEGADVYVAQTVTLHW